MKFRQLGTVEKAPKLVEKTSFPSGIAFGEHFTALALRNCKVERKDFQQKSTPNKLNTAEMEVFINIVK